MSGGGGFFGGPGGPGGGHLLDEIYGSTRKDQIVKTLEQELVERGFQPRPGDESIRLRYSLWPKVFLVLGVVLILGVLGYVVVWEILPDGPGEFCPSPFQRCERR